MGSNVPSCLCGLCSVCKHRECQRRYKRKNPEKISAMKRRAKKTPRGREITKYQCRRNYSRHIERHRDYNRSRQRSPKTIARARLNSAVRSGKVVRLPCMVCGFPKAQAHHEDYSKPLDVIWLCGPCHAIADGKTKHG